MIARNAAIVSLALSFGLLLSGEIGLATEASIPQASPGGSESRATNTNSKKDTPTTKIGSPIPSPVPAGVSSTPTQESINLTKQDLRTDVESALAEAKDAGFAARTTDFRQIARLEQRVDHFRKKLDASDVNLVELQSEANEIIGVANRIRDEQTPSLWDRLFGFHFIDYLNRVVILTGLLLAIGIIILLVRLNARVRWSSHSLQHLLNENLGSLRTLQSTANSSVKLLEERPVLGNESMESLSKEIRVIMDEVIASLDQFGKIILDRFPQQEVGISPDEESPIESEITAEQVYVGEFLQSAAKDRQIAVAYEIANSIFVADSLGKLVVVINNQNSNIAVVLPKASRLNSPEQFYTYLKEAYRCEHVSVGPMFILTPAIVEKVMAGWRLVTSGILEIRG